MTRFQKLFLLFGFAALCGASPVWAEGTKVSGKVAVHPAIAKPKTGKENALPPPPLSLEAMMTQNLKKLHDKLTLNAAQEKLWSVLETTVKDNNKKMIESMRQTHIQAPQMHNLSLLEMLDRRDTMMRQRLAIAQTIRKTLEPFYKSLTTQQQDIMNQQTMMDLGLFL